MSRLDKLPKEFQKEVFRRLFEASEIAQFSEDKRTKYEQEMISERDYNNILNTARDDGYEKGRQEGREEGREEGKYELIKTMKSNGVSVSDIAKMTGLDERLISDL